MCKVKIGSDVFDIPEEHSLKLKHLHPGNSTRKDRHGGKYRTIARLIHETTGTVVAQDDAVCGHKDVPSREMGRRIAIGRVLAHCQWGNK
jgi:hypothetical protein